MARKSTLPPPPAEEEIDDTEEEVGTDPDGDATIKSVENLKRREENLPHEDERSVPEIKASESVRNMRAEDLCEKINIHPYNNWYILVMRTGPREYKDGRTVDERKVLRFDSAMRWPEIVSRIEESNGGGTFGVRFYDNRGQCVRQQTITLPMAPKWPKNVYPEFAQEENENDDEIKHAEKELKKMGLEDEMDKKRSQREERQLNLQFKKAEVTGGGLKDMMALFAEERRAAAEREDRRAEAERARQEKHDIEIKELQTQQMQLMEKLTSGGSQNMGAIIAAITQSQNTMMQMQMESAKIQREISAESMRAQTEQANRNMELFFRMSEMRGAGGNSDDMFIKLLELQGTERANSFQIATDIVKTMLPIIQGQGEDSEKPVAVQVIEAAGLVADKFGGMIGNAIKLRELGKPPQIARKPAPGAKQGGPAPQQAGGEAPKAEEAPVAPTPENIRGTYPTAPIPAKIELIISSLLLEADAAPSPEKALWLELLENRTTPPEILDPVLNHAGDVTDLKALVVDMVRLKNPEQCDQIRTALDAPAVTQWLQRCVEYIQKTWPAEPEDDDEDTKA